MMNRFGKFLRAHPPTEDVRPCSPEECARYAGRLPASVLALWSEVGRGAFSHGLLALVDPAEWEDELADWLGGFDPSRVPIARSAFGDLFYYRDKGLHDLGGVPTRVEDVCRLDVHYHSVEVCTWSAEEFFSSYLCDKGIIDEVLRKPLFDAALPRLGAPGSEEAYLFAPALALGGSEDADTIHKGGVREHLSILRAM